MFDLLTKHWYGWTWIRGELGKRMQKFGSPNVHCIRWIRCICKNQVNLLQTSATCYDRLSLEDLVLASWTPGLLPHLRFPPSQDFLGFSRMSSWLVASNWSGRAVGTDWFEGWWSWPLVGILSWHSTALGMTKYKYTGDDQQGWSMNITITNTDTHTGANTNTNTKTPTEIFGWHSNALGMTYRVSHSTLQVPTFKHFLWQNKQINTCTQNNVEIKFKTSLRVFFFYNRWIWF